MNSTLIATLGVAMLLLAHLSKYRVVEYPELDQEWYQILAKFSDNKSTQALREQLGIYYPMYNELRELSQMSGIQARMVSVPRIE